jgi:hypothetical protein
MPAEAIILVVEAVTKLRGPKSVSGPPGATSFQQANLQRSISTWLSLTNQLREVLKEYGS